MSDTIEKGILTEDVKKTLDTIINSYRDKQGTLVAVLHEVQEFLGYIPYEVQKYIAVEMNVALSEIYGVVTFYSRFTLKPTGKYKVGVCLGTACYVRGSDKVLSKVEEALGVKSGETSADGMYSVEATRCVGACGLAPVMTVNEDVYGKLTANQVPDILNKYRAEGDAK